MNKAVKFSIDNGARKTPQNLAGLLDEALVHVSSMEGPGKRRALHLIEVVQLYVLHGMSTQTTYAEYGNMTKEAVMAAIEAS